MFVLLGPDFEGTDVAYQRLARATGLVPYELRSRVRPGNWGLVKALADPEQAEVLARGLTQAGFRPVLVPRAVAHDPERRIVAVRSIELRDGDFVLGLRDRDMPVEFGALAAVVRGEVLPGRTAQRSGFNPSSASFRAAAAASEPLSSREPAQSPFEAYQAADVHFLSVHWVARLDVHALGSAHEATPRALDAFVDELGRRAHVRVDRGIRNSSIVALAEQSASSRSLQSEPPSIRGVRRENGDERFDSYSRVIGEAERLLRQSLH